jgi:CubicO group peptidase (beta-lactamase class C family)
VVNCAVEIEETGMDDVVAYLQQVIDEGQIPGAVLRVERGDTLLHETVAGLRHTEPPRPMQADTLFDIASLTKIVGTLGTLLTLFEADHISPHTRLAELLPLPVDKQTITIEQCLAHTSGLPPFRDLSSSVMEIADFALDAAPGTQVIYSDLGFLLLGKVIEVVTGLQLAEAVQHRLRGWGLLDTSFSPADRVRCAATEWRPELGRHQLGEVHDERATTLGGVAGHAGLFSTAADLARYAALYLPGRATPWFARSRMDVTAGLNERRGLGWQLWTPDCFAGPLASPNGFGHTGFTGTSLWIDPDRELVIVLLTNRVHFGRQLHILAIRKQVHTLIYRALGSGAKP